MTAATQPKQKPAERLTALEQEIAETRKQVNDTDSKHSALSEELASLLGKQAHGEVERIELQQAHAEVQRTVQDARTALTRHIGKPTENIYVQRLAEAEALAAPPAQALADFDKRTDREAINARIQELRTLIPQTEAESIPLRARLHELDEQRARALAMGGKEAYVRVLTAYLDLFITLEADGPAISWLRTEAPTEWNALLWDLSISQKELFDMLVPCPSPDGKSNDFRPLVRERQAAIRDRLKKLQP